jgi:hypothetical protein
MKYTNENQTLSTNELSLFDTLPIQNKTVASHTNTAFINAVNNFRPVVDTPDTTAIATFIDAINTAGVNTAIPTGSNIIPSKDKPIQDIIGRIHEKSQKIRDNSNDIELQEKIANKAVENMIVQQVTTQYLQSGIDIINEFNQFIDIRNSQHTGATYKTAIKQFLDWCNANCFDTLNLIPTDSDKYQLELSNKYSSNSIHTKIGAIKSFFVFLINRYPTAGIHNPFYRITVT